MSVFTSKRLAALTSVTKTLFERAVAHHKTPELTVDDIYYSLVRPEHAPRLRETDVLVGRVQVHSYYHTCVYLPDNPQAYGLAIKFEDAMVRLMPAYCSQGFHEYAPPDAMEKINAWVQRRYEIGMGFSKIRDLMGVLDNELKTPGQMKFYFNGIVTLIAMLDDGAKMANQLREAPVPSKLPSISRELRDAGIEATKFLSRMLLLPKETPAVEGPVQFVMSGFGWQKLFKYPTEVW